METITGNIFQVMSQLANLPNEDKQKIFDVSEHKEKRSLSQNAYSWKLSNQLADKLGMSKEDMHFRLLKDYGQGEVISVLSGIDISGYFTYCEAIGTGTINNKEFTHYKVYKPTHEMNSYEMAKFIDGLVQECESVGIPTFPKEKIKEMRLI